MIQKSLEAVVLTMASTKAFKGHVEAEENEGGKIFRQEVLDSLKKRLDDLSII